MQTLSSFDQLDVVLNFISTCLFILSHFLHRLISVLFYHLSSIFEKFFEFCETSKKLSFKFVNYSTSVKVFTEKDIVSLFCVSDIFLYNNFCLS